MSQILQVKSRQEELYERWRDLRVQSWEDPKNLNLAMETGRAYRDFMESFLPKREGDGNVVPLRPIQ